MTTSIGAPQAFPDCRGNIVKIVAWLPDGVGADLPDRQYRGLGNHIVVHPRELFRGFLTFYPPVEHVDHAVRILVFQGRLQPVCKGHDVAFTYRR